MAKPKVGDLIIAPKGASTYDQDKDSYIPIAGNKTVITHVADWSGGRVGNEECYYITGCWFDEATERVRSYNGSFYGGVEVVGDVTDLKLPLAATYKLQTITIGSDPEVFVGDKETGELIPAWEVFEFPTSHKEEIPYWDGFQAEFKTCGSTCAAAVTDSFRNGLKAIAAKGKVILDSVVDISKFINKNLAEKHYELGCNPSFNAYGRSGQPVVDGRELPVRFAGMHMHFGFDKYKKNKPLCVDAVKVLDAMLGVTLTAIGGEDENPVRRVYYGLPGEFRMPAHGMEYRVPASWLMKHPALINLAFDLARFALNAELLDMFKSNWDFDADEVCDIITNSNVRAARELLARKKNRATLREFVDGAYVKQNNVPQLHGKGNWALPKAKRLTVDKAEDVLWKILSGELKFDPEKFMHYWIIEQGRNVRWADHGESPTRNMFSLMQAGGVLA